MTTENKPTGNKNDQTMKGQQPAMGQGQDTKPGEQRSGKDQPGDKKGQHQGEHKGEHKGERQGEHKGEPRPGAPSNNPPQPATKP